MEETEKKSINNIFEALGTLEKGKKGNLLRSFMSSSSKLNLLNQDSNQSLLLLNTVKDIALVNQKSEVNRARLNNSLYEQQEEGKKI